MAEFSKLFSIVVFVLSLLIFYSFWFCLVLVVVVVFPVWVLLFHLQEIWLAFCPRNLRGDSILLNSRYHKFSVKVYALHVFVY